MKTKAEPGETAQQQSTNTTIIEFMFAPRPFSPWNKDFYPCPRACFDVEKSESSIQSLIST